MNILDLIVGADLAPALIPPGGPVLTYQQLRHNLTQLITQLHRFGLGAGDRIAIAMPNGCPMVLSFLAASLCGTAAPLNPKYKPDEFAFYYEDTQAKALITLPGTVEAAIAAASPTMQLIQVQVNPDSTIQFELVRSPQSSDTQSSDTQSSNTTSSDTQATAASGNPALPEGDAIAMILHTSGTTSRPKRVPIRHRNLIASAQNIIRAYDLSDRDRTLCLMPLFHIHGLVGCLLSTLASGGALICPNGFNALEFWPWVQQFQPTWYSAAPTMHQMILSRAHRNAEIVQANPFRFIRSSSAPLPPIVIEQLETTLKAPLLESYSMTESAHMMTTNPLPPQARKPGTVGVGVGVEVGIMDEEGNLLSPGRLGEVVVRGANVIDGYENNPDANAKAFVQGWFRTGDQGKLDGDGYLQLTGRLKELINRGGEKISPLEVDDVLLRHSAIAEALAFAVPHPALGEDIHAAVVLKEDMTIDSVTAKELKAHCAALLADFKVPNQIHILPELPRGATGKLQRLNMAKLLQLQS